MKQNAITKYLKEIGARGGKNRWVNATDKSKKAVGKRLAEARAAKRKQSLVDNPKEPA
jgi:hypothetical protein